MGREATLLAIILIHKWLVCADHALGHGCFGDVVAQKGEFRRDPWNAPGWVLFRHAPNQTHAFNMPIFASSFTVEIGHSRQALDRAQIMQVLDSERGRDYW